MDTLSFPVTLDEYSCFHAMERALFSLLALELWLDPDESVQTLAFWLWLERLGFNNVLKRILSLPHNLINEFAKEASTCLRCIKNPQFLFSAEATDIPLTCNLIKMKITLQFLSENQDAAFDEVHKIVAVLGATALADIIEEAIKRHTARDLWHTMTMSPFLERSLIHSFANLGFACEMPKGTTRGNGEPPALGPFFIHSSANLRPAGEMSKGSISGNGAPPAPAQPLVHRFGNLALAGETARGSIPVNGIAQEDRTMFVTFSKGYPVSESDVKEFFTKVFGECIESFYMQPVPPDEQPLYAKVVFHKPYIIDLVLNGVPKAKFTINGKHLWMRKFVPKHATSL